MSEKTDETTTLQPKWNNDGLIAAIAQDYKSKDILMMAWVNEDALNHTLKTGEAHYWSRSRQCLWHKGATSGNIQKIHEIRIDCDQDALIFMIEQTGEGACHTGRTSCFYRRIDESAETLIFTDL